MRIACSALFQVLPAPRFYALLAAFIINSYNLRPIVMAAVCANTISICVSTIRIVTVLLLQRDMKSSVGLSTKEQLINLSDL